MIKANLGNELSVLLLWVQVVSAIPFQDLLSAKSAAESPPLAYSPAHMYTHGEAGQFIDKMFVFKTKHLHII